MAPGTLRVSSCCAKAALQANTGDGSVTIPNAFVRVTPARLLQGPGRLARARQASSAVPLELVAGADDVDESERELVVLLGHTRPVVKQLRVLRPCAPRPLVID